MLPDPLQDRLLNNGLLEAARASWWHSIFLASAGSKFGRGVFWDTTNFQVSAPAGTGSDAPTLTSLSAKACYNLNDPTNA